MDMSYEDECAPSSILDQYCNADLADTSHYNNEDPDGYQLPHSAAQMVTNISETDSTDGAVRLSISERRASIKFAPLKLNNDIISEDNLSVNESPQSHYIDMHKEFFDKRSSSIKSASPTSPNYINNFIPQCTNQSNYMEMNSVKGTPNKVNNHEQNVFQFPTRTNSLKGSPLTPTSNGPQNHNTPRRNSQTFFFPDDNNYQNITSPQKIPRSNSFRIKHDSGFYSPTIVQSTHSNPGYGILDKPERKYSQGNKNYQNNSLLNKMYKNGHHHQINPRSINSEANNNNNAPKFHHSVSLTSSGICSITEEIDNASNCML